MKSNVVLMLILLFAMCSFGASVSEDGLTERQAAQLQIKAAELRLASLQNPTSTADEVAKWVLVGEQMGRGLATCAKELGIEANKFVQTPVGKVTAVIIVWKFLGRDIMHFGFGFVFFSTGLCLWSYLFRKICIVQKISLENKKNWLGLRDKTVSYYREGEVDGTRGCMFVILVIFLIVSCAIIFS